VHRRIDGSEGRVGLPVRRADRWSRGRRLARPGRRRRPGHRRHPGAPVTATHPITAVPIPPDATCPAAASTAIRSVLAGPPRPVHVLAVFPAATYLAHADGIVALVAADGVRHPNALVLAATAADTPFAGYRVHEPGTI